MYHEIAQNVAAIPEAKNILEKDEERTPQIGKKILEGELKLKMTPEEEAILKKIKDEEKLILQRIKHRYSEKAETAALDAGKIRIAFFSAEATAFCKNIQTLLASKSKEFKAPSFDSEELAANITALVSVYVKKINTEAVDIAGSDTETADLKIKLIPEIQRRMGGYTRFIALIEKILEAFKDYSPKDPERLVSLINVMNAVNENCANCVAIKFPDAFHDALVGKIKEISIANQAEKKEDKLFSDILNDIVGPQKQKPVAIVSSMQAVRGPSVPAKGKPNPVVVAPKQPEQRSSSILKQAGFRSFASIFNRKGKASSTQKPNEHQRIKSEPPVVTQPKTTNQISSSQSFHKQSSKKQLLQQRESKPASKVKGQR